MLSTTLDAIRAIVKADPSITAPERTALLATIRGQPNKTTNTHTEPRGERVIRPKAAGELLSRSPRGMHLLAEQGVLAKVYLPGRKRSAGFRLADVEALITTALPSAPTTEASTKLKGAQ